MDAIKILNRETLYSGKNRFEKVSYSYTGTNGEEHSNTREVLFRPAAAAILLYDADRKMILLTKQVRLPVALNSDPTGMILEACAGLLDGDELPEHCIIREVEEETGYRISEIQKIAAGYLSPGVSTEYMYLFFGKYSPDMKIAKGGGLEDEGEDITNVELAYAEAKQKLFAGEINDMKTIALLQRAMISGIL